MVAPDAARAHKSTQVKLTISITGCYLQNYEVFTIMMKRLAAFLARDFRCSCKPG
jgi:hypothetical protein